MNWRLAEAKNKLSEVMSRALTDGPQRIRRRDQVVVVLSEAEYQRLTGERETLTAYLLSGPDLSELELTRDPEPMREVAWRGSCWTPASSSNFDGQGPIRGCAPGSRRSIRASST